VGLCDQAPAAFLQHAGEPSADRLFGDLTPERAWALLDGDLSAAEVARPRLPQQGDPSLMLLRRAGVVDPTSLDAYRASGGYQALRRAFELGAEGVIREVSDSKLMGRGGAAFPTGRKWEAVARQPARPHYIICNADESEPGTFKDRVILEDDPFALVESMTIAGYATNCAQGYIYLRGEYPLAIERVQNAIDQAYVRGLLGANIMKQGFSFDLEIRKGAGAYICGEETAIFNSIEGFRGEPRNKPPFPVNSGLFRKPTVINNVETLVNVPLILEMGGAAFAAIGTAQSTGPKLFCLSGDVARPGVYEVPFGATIRDLIDLAGGVPGGRAMRAVLLGGAAGNFMRPDELDVPLTFEGGARGAGLARLGGDHGVRRERGPPGRRAPHRRLLPRRVVRAVRAVPRGHRAPGGGAAPHRARTHARHHGRRARAARRDRAGDEGRVDLRARPDRLRRGGVGDQAPRRLRRRRRGGGRERERHRRRGIDRGPGTGQRLRQRRRAVGDRQRQRQRQWRRRRQRQRQR
jgi:NADH:ubiquinone oxidoreductase subunit F (NADH-binding)